MIVLSIDDGTIRAKIDNNLLTPHLRYNQEITFKPEHVYDIFPKSKHAPEVVTRKAAEQQPVGKKRNKGKGI